MPKKEYSWFHDVLLEALPPYEFKVYCVLAKGADRETQVCWPFQTTIVRESLCSRTQVKKLLKRLEDLHLIVIQSTQAGNRYKMLPVDEADLRKRIKATKAPPTVRSPRDPVGSPRDPGGGHHVALGGSPRDPVKEQDLINKTQREQDSKNKTPEYVNPVASTAKSAVVADPKPEPARRVLTPEEEEEREQKARNYHAYQERLNGGRRRFTRKPELVM